MEVCILIGGRSSRMGREKPLIQFGRVALIDNLLKIISRFSDHTYLIANRDNLPLYAKYVSDSVSLIQDEIEDVGPLGGIHAGLKAIKNTEAFFFASDLPNLNSELLFGLQAEYMKKPVAFAAVCKIGAYIEPLVAVYSKKILPVLLSQIEECNLKIRDLLKRVDTVYFEPSCPPETFLNINEPKDIESV